MELLKRIVSDDSGQGLVEYALIIVLVAVVVIGALEMLGVNLYTYFDKAGTKLAELGTKISELGSE